MQQLTRINLLGVLGEEFTPAFDAAVTSVHDAIRLLEVNFEGFRQHIIEAHESGWGYQVLVGDDWELDEDQLSFPVGNEEITIVPVLAASGNFGKIILGVALLGLGLTGVGFLGISASTLALTGGTLALSGFAGLFNKPKAPNPTESKQASFIFNGAVNTTAAGNVVPVQYGLLVIGSQVISASVRSYAV